MTPNSLSQDEATRLLALRHLGVLDTPPEDEFDAIVEAAALLCEVPISLISLVDQDRQWFKANYGLSRITETPRNVSFCAHAITGDDLFEVHDAASDPRFLNNPLVTAAPSIRFYAGVPLRMDGGEKLGTICVIDDKPGQLTQTQRAILLRLSKAAVQLLKSRQLTNELTASQNRFRALSDSSPLGVFATDRDGACTYTNDRWQTIFHLSQAQAEGHGWSSTLHPKDRTIVLDEWMRTAKLKRDFDMRFRVQHPNGVVRSVRAVARSVTGSDGVHTGFVGSVEDVTQQLEADRALNDERQRLATFIDGTNVGTWEWNVQTGETRFNHQWAQIVGLTLEDLSPMSIVTWNRLVHPDDLTRSSALLEQHFAGEIAVYECESRLRHADGHWVWVLDRGRVLTRTNDGEPEWMLGTHLDIAQRKVREQQLRKTQWLLNRTGELANVGGWELDLVDNNLIWSDQTCKIHGIKPGSELSLDEALNFYAPQARPMINAAMEKAVVDGIGWDLELPLIRADGGQVWVRTVGNLEAEGGKPVRLIGAIQNVTERVERNQELQEARTRLAMASGNKT